jgi:predicted ATP-grasp superfamily ATP-dependent carboligase
MKVLVTDGGYENALAITRSLGRKGINVSVLSDNSKAITFYSRYCKEKILCPKVTDEDRYEKFIEKILSENKYDLLIPVSTGATLTVAKNKNILERYTNLVLSDYDKIVKAMDKRFVYELAADLGIPYPRTIYPENIDQIKNDINGFKYPIVLKARQQTWFGHKVDYAYNKEELKDICIKVKQETGDFPMIQEYINGEGYGFFGFYDKGKCKRIFMHKRIREIPPSGGASACAESYYDDKLKYYGKKILDTLDWHGVAMVEFKKSFDGAYKIMEVNPRFWGSLDLAIAAGVDFPYYLAQIAKGEDLDYSEQYCRNMKFQWIFTREIRHIIKRPRSLKGFLRDLFDPRVKSDVRIKDILPNVIEAQLILKTYGIKLLKKLVGGAC